MTTEHHYTTLDENALRGVEALRYTSVIICLFNATDGQLVYQNSAATATFGHHHSPLRLFQERFTDPVAAHQVWQALQENPVYYGEHLFRSVSGTVCHRLHCRRIHDTRDGQDYIVTNQEDLSRYKDIEARLQLTETRYQQLFLHNPAVMLLIDPTDGAIIDANQAAARYYGYPLPVLKQKYNSDLNALPPEQIQHEQNQATAEQRAYFFLQHRLASGAIREVEVHSGPITLNQRPLLHLIVHDITDRRLTEQALQISQNRLVEAQRIAKLGNWEWDIQQDKLYWSEELYHLLGVDPKTCEASYSLFLSHVHPEDVESLKDTLRDAVHRQHDYYAEYRIIRDDGTERFIHGEGHFKYNEHNEPYQLVGITQDVTEVKLLELSLRQARDAANAANKAKSEFLANVSHELRTPLNAILGYTELLQEEAKTLPTCQFMLQDLMRVHESGSHLLMVIDDILDLSKIETGQLALNLATVELVPLIEAIIANMLPLINKGHNTIEYVCHPTINQFYTDPVKLRQIIFNLLSNAAKFTQRGHIQVNLQPHSIDSVDWLWITVSDTGIGMSPEQMRHIFEPFSQADTSSTRRFGGTGLGLTISRYYCQMMNGNLEVTSELHQGSSFIVKLPILPMTTHWNCQQ